MDEWSDAPAADEGSPTMSDVFDQLRELEATVEDEEQRELVAEAIQAVLSVRPRTFGNVISGFDRADAGEAFLGSLIFGIPMFVEGGTLEVGAFFATSPVFLLATLVAAVLIVINLLYVANFQDVRIQNPILGVIPRRLVGVLGIAFITALVVMTGWGRVDWTMPWLAINQVSVAFVPMAVGAALGDILPGS